MVPGSNRSEDRCLRLLLPSITWKWLCRPRTRRLFSRNKYLLLSLVSVGMLVVFIEVNFGTTVPEADPENEFFPNIVAEMVSEEELSFEEQERQRRAGIFTRILQKQLKRERSEQNQTWCIHPKLDLSHDSNQFAFYEMPALNCTGSEMFYSRKGVIVTNSSKIPAPSFLGECTYYYVGRVDDDAYYYAFLETRTPPPFEISIPHDFVRINCLLQSTLDENKASNEKKSRFSSGPYADSVKNEHYDQYENKHSKLVNSSVTKTPKEEKLRTEHTRKATVHNTSKTELNEALESEENSEEYDPDWEVDIVEDNARDPETTYSDFDQLLVQIHPQPWVFQRIARAEAIATNRRSMKLNVLMFALDSMSHLSYQRKLPKTYKMLKKELGAAILQNYNIVGDATTAAIIPMLTGQTEMVLPEVRLSHMQSGMVDKYPLIWKNFSEHGYVTLFAEDEPSMSTFNLRLNGFQSPPTDHYMRPFWQALWDSTPRRNSPRFCSGNTANHRFTLHYVEDFFVKYHNVSKFAFAFHGELTHDDNNPGQHMDDDLVNLLTRLKRGKVLEDTVLIVFSDHGARYSKVRHTVQGKLEERLPFMSFVFPSKFRQHYPLLYRNLMTNTQRLSTPFDVHETLVHLLDLSQTSRPVSTSTSPGMSLLREIPAERTCADAGIGLHWCACLHQVRIDPGEEFVQPAAQALMRYLNALTASLRKQCAQLKLSKVVSVYIIVPNEKVLKYERSMDSDQREAIFSKDVDVDVIHYQLLVQTEPCGALYEGTVMADFRDHADYKFTVTPGISRTNKYGVQPQCVDRQYPWLRKFCCCLEYVAKSNQMNV